MSSQFFKPKPLKDQTIVITGASSGIGLATAQKASSQGANVVICSRNAYVLSDIADDLRNQGGRILPLVADVSDLRQVEKLRDEALETFGTIDTWVNNAGLSIYGYLTETPLDEEKRIFDVNFWGLRHGCRVAIPVLAQKGGVLINLGSEASGRSIPLQGMYAATKHAAKAYTDALRMELEKEKVPVHVCLIRPGSVNTPFTLHARNELHSGAPSYSGPVYHPNLVADEILKCAVKPKRDVYVGRFSKMYSLLEALAPRMLDLYMERKLFDQQSQGARFPHQRMNESLASPPMREGQVTGGHKGRVITQGIFKKLRT